MVKYFYSVALFLQFAEALLCEILVLRNWSQLYSLAGQPRKVFTENHSQLGVRSEREAECHFTREVERTEEGVCGRFSECRTGTFVRWGTYCLNKSQGEACQIKSRKVVREAGTCNSG